MPPKKPYSKVKPSRIEKQEEKQRAKTRQTTQYSDKAWRQKLGDDYYPGFVADYNAGLLDPENRDQIRYYKELRDYYGVPPKESIAPESTWGEILMGKEGVMRQHPMGTPQERQTRRSLMEQSYGRPQVGKEGEAGYIAGKPGQLQQAIQELQQYKGSPLEHQMGSIYGNLAPYLSRNIMAYEQGNYYPSEMQNLPSPNSPQMQLGVPSAYGYQAQPQSDFSYLMGQYGPQAGAAIGDWINRGGPKEAWQMAQKYGPQAMEMGKQYGGQAMQLGSQYGGQALRGAADMAAYPIYKLARGAESAYDAMAPYAQRAGSSVWNALSGLVGR